MFGNREERVNTLNQKTFFYNFIMLTLLLIICLCVAPACGNTFSPLVASFTKHLSTSLSLLPQESIESEFNVGSVHLD